MEKKCLDCIHWKTALEKGHLITSQSTWSFCEKLCTSQSLINPETFYCSEYDNGFRI